MEQGIDIFTTAQLVFYICGICDKYDYYSIAKGKDGITAVEAIEYSSAARAKVSWTKYSSLLLNQVHSQTITNYSHYIYSLLYMSCIHTKYHKRRFISDIWFSPQKSFCSNNFVPLYLLACCLNCFFHHSSCIVYYICNKKKYRSHRIPSSPLGILCRKFNV